MDFAVRIEGVTPEGKGTWVLAVEGERVLVAYGDRSFHWHDLADCTLFSAATPDQPRLVMPVNQNPRPELLVPNRVSRRSNGVN